MFDRAGAFVGDKIGAVQGKLRTNRFRIAWPGRRARTIRRARRHGARRGRQAGLVVGWITAGWRWMWGIF